ncbi:DNA replication complex GINS family protein [Candidatus Micrarchaeota archaeon]|nr:DNA replication complex GINS family protein [Candidatus Micrarchaeota archaeon]
MEELSYRRLRELQRQEKEAAALVALPKDFYASLCGFLKEKRQAAHNEGEMERREFDNIIRIVKDMSGLRRQKILFRAVRSGQKHETEGMTVQEHELYDRLCTILSDEGKWLENVCNGEVTVDAQEQSMASVKKVKLLKEMPEYKGSDNLTYGPFRAGEEAALPASEADWLVRGKFAQVL